MRASVALTVGASLAVLLASCARFGASPAPETPISHPAGDALVLRLATAGGFVPADYLFASIPGFTLTGDGRVIMVGAQDLIYPGPALPALNVRRLTDEGIQLVLREAVGSGQLDDDADWLGANRFVADAPDSVFTLHADGREVSVRVYALGILDPERPSDWPQVSADELAAHRSLRALSDRLMTLDAWLPSDAWADPAWQPYEAAAIRLLVRDADGEAPNPDGPPFQELPWPVTGDPATFGDPAAWAEDARCGVVAGADSGAWYAALADANQLTRWTSGGHRYALTIRPLLPDEAQTCPPSL